MEILDYQIIYIDNIEGAASIAVFSEKESIDKYTIDIITRALSKQDRKYKFNDNKRTTRDRILNIAANKSIGDWGTELGNDLASSEKNKNEEIRHLKNQIPLGVLIVAYVHDDNNEFILLLKSDYDKFISEATGQIQTGLSLKNQIYKTCRFSINRGEHEVQFSEITTSDSNKRQSEYWHKDFLELVPVYSDSHNTTTAYNAIKDLFKPFQKSAPSDYTTMRRMTIGYFRQEGTFDIDYFKDEIIGKYNPHDPAAVNIKKITEKIEKLRTKGTFDPVFNKDTSAVKDRIRGIHKLTDEMDLKVKTEIANPENFILPYDTNGRKGIAIISELGFKFAKQIQDNKKIQENKP